MANIVKLVIDEENHKDGVFAISLVEDPAIELDFIALTKENEHQIELKTVSEEKRLVMGPVLVPNFPMLRKAKDGTPYYILFEEDTIRQASQLYLKKHNQNNATLEHELHLEGVFVAETWLKEDEVHDKSVKYNIEAPLGSWMVAMKIENNEVWEDYVKTGKVKGFSIEGLFEDEMKVAARKLDKEADKLVKEPDFLTFLDELLDYIDVNY